MAAVRYLVHDVNKSVHFYTEVLGFTLKQQFGPAMAIVASGELTLWLGVRPRPQLSLCQTDADPSRGDGIVSYLKSTISVNRAFSTRDLA